MKNREHTVDCRSFLGILITIASNYVRKGKGQFDGMEAEVDVYDQRCNNT